MVCIDIRVLDNIIFNNKNNIIFKCIIDIKKPEITCPVSTSYDADKLENSTTVSWSIPTTSDNSELAVSLNQTHGVSNNSRLEVGTYEIRYQATDTSGNTQSCFFSVTVNREVYFSFRKNHIILLLSTWY